MAPDPTSSDPFARALASGDKLAATLDADGRRYWAENRKRISAAVAHAATFVNQIGQAPRILDVAPALELPLLAELLPSGQFSTMGWADHRYRLPQTVAHHPLDLNDTVQPARCPVPVEHDLVLLLEVIEHVHVSPLHVFRYLRDWVRPGGTLLVSTPNAAWIRNRWRLLCGRNPYELIREDLGNPGHFRELTREELRVYLTDAGFEVTGERLENLYEFGSASGRRFTRLASLLPSAFRHDMLFTARRPLARGGIQ